MSTMPHSRSTVRRRNATRRSAALATIVAAVALVLAGCASPKDDGGADPMIQGQWQLQSAKDAGGQMNLLGQSITLTIDGDDTTEGRSSCSNYKARFLGNAPSLYVTATLPKEIDCGSALQQNLELRYITALNDVRSATVTGGVLDLTAPGIDLHYVRALFLPMTRVVGHSWALTSVNFLSFEGASAASGYEARGVTITFAKNGTLTARSDCTSFSARYTQDAGQVVASHVVVHTKSNCSDYNSAADDYIVRVVDASFSFSSSTGGELTLTCPRVGVILGFVEASNSTGELGRG